MTLLNLSRLCRHKNCEDRLIWLLEKNGTFSIRTAYRKMFQEQDTSDSVGPRLIKIYKSLWKLPLLPRIWQFLWKAVSSLLPTKDLLSTRIPGISSLCPLCEQATETPAHLLVECSISRAVWFSILGWSSVLPASFSDWIQTWFDDLHAKKITESTWEAINLAQRLQLQNVHFELDAKTVVEAVHNLASIDWQLLNIIRDIQSFFSSFHSWKCSYIPKERNKIADVLSKLTRDNTTSMAWSNFPPVKIRAQLLEDKSYVVI